MLAASLWSFGAHVCPQRAERLLSLPSFENVIGQFRPTMPVRLVWEKPRNAFLEGCERASFLLEVSEDTYDAFFNSPVGYRAQYARSISAGLQANRKFLDAMWVFMYSSAWTKGGVDLERIEASLTGYDAKVWILESEVSAQMGRYVSDILYEPWMQRSTDGAGLLAPVGKKIEVLGAWIDGNDNERRDPLKAHRATEIHETGDT